MDNIDLSEYGFRKGFSFETRFMLKTKVTYEGTELTISTVDLGLDHNFVEGGKPLYYETMIFDSSRHFFDNQYRYSTEEEARAAHEKIVKAFADNKVKLIDDYFSIE